MVEIKCKIAKNIKQSNLDRLDIVTIHCFDYVRENTLIYGQ